MREWVLAGAALMAISGSAAAQQPASSFFSGIPSARISNVPVDTSKALGQHPGQSALTSNRFDFSALFRRAPTLTFPTTRGVSALPPPSSFPSTKYQSGKLVGTPPYPIKYMFGSGKSPIQPAVPFTPGSKTPVGPGSG